MSNYLFLFPSSSSEESEGRGDTALGMGFREVCLIPLISFSVCVSSEKRVVISTKNSDNNLHSIMDNITVVLLAIATLHIARCAVSCRQLVSLARKALSVSPQLSLQLINKVLFECGLIVLTHAWERDAAGGAKLGDLAPVD